MLGGRRKKFAAFFVAYFVPWKQGDTADECVPYPLEPATLRAWMGHKGGYGPLNPILFSPQKKSSARLFPTSSSRQPVRVAEAFRIGPGAKARVVHVWPTYRWHPARRASS